MQHDLHVTLRSTATTALCEESIVLLSVQKKKTRCMNILVFSTTQLSHELNMKQKDDRVVKTSHNMYPDIRDAFVVQLN